ncbi:MAG: hypothetical protein JWP27_1418 [Flaviaesturariibacter sp.]|nr:hypothetical protein [Flaviaesturariibacter sp.]
MDYQNQPYRDGFQPPQRSLPNATTVLVLGILSIVFCFICGIIALSMASGDKRLYEENPELYTTSSYELLRAGRICSIISLCLLGAGLLIFLFVMTFAISVGSFNN